MALITHRCTRCSHPDYWRQGRDHCPREGCGCACIPGPPEVAPTFDQTGQPIERILPLGGNLGEHRDLPLCGCDDCTTLYENLTPA